QAWSSRRRTRSGPKEGRPERGPGITFGGVERLVMWVRRHGWTVDLPLYAVFLFLAPTGSGEPPWVIRAIPMLFLLPLLVRRRFPRTVAVLTIAGAAAVYYTE